MVNALNDTGINRMMLPGLLGGLETPTADAVQVFEKISAVDGSTGWCAVIGAGAACTPNGSASGPSCPFVGRAWPETPL